MKNPFIYVIVALLSFLLLESCNPVGDGDGCDFEQERLLDGEEFYIFEREGVTIFSSFLGLSETEFLPCDRELEVPDVGYDSIFAVYGLYTVNCETSACIEVDSLISPACKQNIVIDSTFDSSLYTRWNIMMLTSAEDTLFPSCNVQNIYFDLEEDVTESQAFPDLGTGVIGLNRVTFSLNLEDSLFSVDNLNRTQDVGAPYVQLVENTIYSLLQQDDLIYTVQFNLMQVSSIETGETLILNAN